MTTRRNRRHQKELRQSSFIDLAWDDVTGQCHFPIPQRLADRLRQTFDLDAANLLNTATLDHQPSNINALLL